MKKNLRGYLGLGQWSMVTQDAVIDCYVHMCKHVLLLSHVQNTLPRQHIPAIQLHQLIHTHSQGESTVRDEAQPEFCSIML
jgi:hypothetical protein